MRLLDGFRDDVAVGHGEVIARESGIGVGRHHLGGFAQGFRPHIAFRFGIHAEAFQLDARAGFAGSPIDPAAADQIERGDSFCDAGGMVVSRRHERHAVSEPDAPRPLAASRQKHLRRGRVRVFLQEVVFHFPDVIDSEPVRQLNLLERVLKQPALIADRPRPWQLMLVENAEFHSEPSP